MHGVPPPSDFILKRLLADARSTLTVFRAQRSTREFHHGAKWRRGGHFQRTTPHYELGFTRYTTSTLLTN